MSQYADNVRDIFIQGVKYYTDGVKVYLDPLLMAEVKLCYYDLGDMTNEQWKEMSFEKKMQHARIDTDINNHETTQQ